MWDVMNASTTCFEIDITPLDGVSATYVYVPATPSHWAAGATSGDNLPQVAAIVKLQTALRGRSHRGRVFLPFVAEGKVANGVLASGNVTNVQSGWSSFVSSLSGGGFTLVVASYTVGHKFDVTSVVAESLAATQRRRQPR
jgi:hypothetical protein